MKKFLVPIMLGMVAFAGLSQAGESRFANASFVGNYLTRESYIAHGMEINAQLADEGFVLLKNNGTLPLPKGSKITVVGKSSINLVRGGAGSTSQGVTSIDLQKSLTDAGFEINETSTIFYKSAPGGRKNGNDSWRGNSEVTIGETPIADVKASTSLMDSWDEYNDLAIQVITREGSEGCDVLTIDATDSVKFGASEKHALELSNNEQDLYDALKEHFDNILILINSSNIFECDQFQKDDQCAGILWIGNPGDVGLGAVGRILCGDVNPSGRTVDTWTRDFTKDPTFQNFSDNRHNTGVEIPNRNGRQNHQSADTMFNADGTPMRSDGTDKHGPTMLEDPEYKVVNGGINGVKPASYVSYEEGVYVDYRYYETKYSTICEEEDVESADNWYMGEEGVVYPFGYGLSYTTFNQVLTSSKPTSGSALTSENDLIEFTVRVTNTGSVAGKDVVQLYWNAPYYSGGIEKAHHVLCAFTKTKLLKPGESQDVYLSFHLQDFANYDFNDANDNGHCGYELDSGSYKVMLMNNAHDSINSQSINFEVKEDIVYNNDRVTENPVVNRFTDNGFYSTMPGENDIEFTQMSRENFELTFPQYPSFEDRKVKEGSLFEDYLNHQYDLLSFEIGDYTYIANSSHATALDTAGYTQAVDENNHTIMLSEMKGLDYDDLKWEEFLNEFSFTELLKLTQNYRMSSPVLTTIGKPNLSEGDGPQKFSIIWWASAPIVAATYNVDLVKEVGDCIGDEHFITGKTGWWGPDFNLHRSPFGGRNFERFSADPFLTGKIGSQIVKNAVEKGIYVYSSHFIVNEQEKNREGGCVFVNEQALREMYFTPFKMAVQEGHTNGIMCSYFRLGLVESAANAPLLTEVLRDEWGFRGAVMCDMSHGGNGFSDFKCYESATSRILAGCGNLLDSMGAYDGLLNYVSWNSELNSGRGALVLNGTDNQVAHSAWKAIRNATKDHLYMIANSDFDKLDRIASIGKRSEEYLVNTAVEIDVEEEFRDLGLGNGASFNLFSNTTNPKRVTVTSVLDYEIDNKTPLPKGLTFADNKISGTPTQPGNEKVNLIAKVFTTSDEVVEIAIAFDIRVSVDRMIGVTYVVEVPSTCTEKGTRAYYIKNETNKEYLDSDLSIEITDRSVLELPLKPHTFDVIPGYASTCTTNGVKDQYVCKECHDTYILVNEEYVKVTNDDDILIVKDGHNFTHFAGSEPTYTATGTKDYYYCNMCHMNYVLVDDEYIEVLDSSTLIIPMKVHSFVLVNGTSSTCNEHGIREHFTCNECDGKFISVDSHMIEVKDESSLVLPYSEHSYKLVKEVPATETDDGVEAHYECNACHKLFIYENNSYIEVSGEDLVIKASKPHSYKFVAEVAATATTAGTKAHYVCEDCNKTFVLENNKYVEVRADQLVIPAHTTHNYEYVAEVPATSTSIGTKAHYVCNECGKKFTHENNTFVEVTNPDSLIIPVHTQHDYKFVQEIAATTSSTGIKAHYECDECNKKFLLEGNTYKEVTDEELVIEVKKQEAPQLGCGGSIASASFLVTAPSLIGAISLLVKKKRK